jgi:hypothetical protein
MDCHVGAFAASVSMGSPIGQSLEKCSYRRKCWTSDSRTFSRGTMANALHSKLQSFELPLVLVHGCRYSDIRVRRSEN